MGEENESTQNVEAENIFDANESAQAEPLKEEAQGSFLDKIEA